MAHIWTFSPSSENLLQKCIAASLPPDENNKWVREFIRKTEINDAKPYLPKNTDEEIEHSNKENTKTKSLDNYKEFIEIIENEYSPHFNSIVEECSKNHDLFIYLAQQLSSASIEKICKQVCTINDISDNFLINFYNIFIPTTIKREYSRYIIDFLVQSREKHKKYLQILLEIMVKDSEIPRNVLNGYILTLNAQEKVEFMINILNMNKYMDAFTNNIQIIYILYKDCVKTNEIQSKMLQNLTQAREYCKNDRMYGKLLLVYLQTENSTNIKINMKLIQSIVDNHRSAFRRPCEMILNKIIEENLIDSD